MNLTGEQLLAAARLAKNEDRCVGWGDELYLREEPAQRGAVADDAAERESVSACSRR